MSSQLQPRPTFKRSRSDLSRSATPVQAESETSSEELRVSLPAFLRQTPIEIRYKFEYIQQLERERHDAFEEASDPEGDHPWAQEYDHETLQRNRYTDIAPWAQSRIHLKAPEGHSDYINASPISLHRSDGQHELQYIATQGPKQTGVDHFWQMVWHECGEVAVVVMLTKLSEGPREKCFQYYPSTDDPAPRPSNSGTPAPPGNTVSNPPSHTPTSSRTSNTDLSTATQPALQLRLTSDDGSEEVAGSITLIDTIWDETSQSVVRKLSLIRGDQSRIVYHLLFSGWPDYGVPQGKDKAALLNLIRLSDEKNDGKQETSPRIVHCSAGVGRTGTFITIEHLIAEIDHGAYDDPKEYEKQTFEFQPEDEDMQDEISTWPDPVFATVARLREQRPVMVQSLIQFSFIYEILADEWIKRRRRILEERRQMAEPSPKAVRIGKGLKKMLHLGREKSISKNGPTNSQGALIHGFFSSKQFTQAEVTRLALVGGLTGFAVMYVVWHWR